MKTLSICGSPLVRLNHSDNVVQSMQLENVSVSCGLIYTDDIQFDSTAPENHFKVLVRMRAFSCNYRDKSLILRAATHAPDQCFYSIGSDFVAEVVDVGAKVEQLQPGDRVINNNCYPDSGVTGVRPGVTSNNSSKEYQIFHQVKLLKIPTMVPDEIAAGFSIGAQTAYSMVRKLEVQPGDNILVTAAKSNTSLFVINALKHKGVNVYATSTSRKFEEELLQMGVKKMIQIDPDKNNWFNLPKVQQLYSETGGINCIVDPFFDLHIGKILPLLVHGEGGRYITCGLYEQYSNFTGIPFQYCGASLSEILTFAMMNNVKLIGNCVGKTEDLQQAIRDYEAGKFSVIIDSTFSGQEVGAFLERTYNSRDRFGKVIYRYSNSSFPVT